MKVWNYMAIMLTMMVFLYFVGFNPAGSGDVLSSAGIQINSTTGELIEGDVGNSDWYDGLFNATNGWLVLLGVGSAIVIGFITKSFEWKLVLIAFFTTFVAKFVTFGWGIINLARDTGETWLIAIIATIFLPITAMFIVSIVEWFGGSDA